MGTFRLGVHAVIVNDEGKVLLLKWTYGDKGWGLPGGGVDPGETIHEAVRRECLEEIGIEIQDPVLTGFYYHRNVNVQAGIFKCSIPKDAEIKLSEEHSEYKWVPIEQLSEVQRIRVIDALTYDGKVVSRVL